MKKFRRIAAAVVVLLIAGVTAFTIIGRKSPELPPLQSLDEAIGFEVASGWQLTHAPDLPGPYRRTGLAHQTSKGGGGGTRWRNDVNEARQKFTPRPDVEQLAIPLETTDGRLTFVVLAR